MIAMDKAETLFLDSLRCAIKGESVGWREMPEQDMLRRLFRLAREHKVLPLVLQAFSGNAAVMELPGVRFFQREARNLSLIQARRTGDFLLVMERLAASGLHPAVLKGAVCRSLYPEPEQRASTDEDLLVSPEDFQRCHEALLACGLRLKDPNRPVEGEDEVTYVDPEREIYLELHLSPFDLEDETCGDCNRFFENVLTDLVPLQIYGQTLYTLSPTDHLLYLFCHAFKHILYGGVGVRQICDVCLYAQRFDREIDWERVRSACEELRLLKLAAAFFRIGERYLDIPCPALFSTIEVDELSLLHDSLSGGLFGVVDMDRLHSSRITLDAVASAKQGRARRGLWNSLFPGAEYLKNLFPFARSHPVLLPVAWAKRICNYVFREKTSAAKSLQIGRERIELLRRYGLLP